MQVELFKRIISSIFLIPITFFLIFKGSYLFVILLVIAFIISSYEWYSMAKYKPYHIYGYIFLIFSFYCIFKFRLNTNDDNWFFVIVFIICILTDIGGFTFGKIFKGPKLIKYSPNKTYSGLVGSYIFSIAVIPFAFSINLVNQSILINFIFFIIVTSSISQIGDIIISYFKRTSKIKDTGKIIPGHGGLLDRIDGMLFAFPVSYFLIITNLFKIQI